MFAREGNLPNLIIAVRRRDCFETASTRCDLALLSFVVYLHDLRNTRSLSIRHVGHVLEFVVAIVAIVGVSVIVGVCGLLVGGCGCVCWGV